MINMSYPWGEKLEIDRETAKLMHSLGRIVYMFHDGMGYIAFQDWQIAEHDGKFGIEYEDLMDDM